MLASLVLAAASFIPDPTRAAAAPAPDGDCNGDPGFVLDMPDHAGIGNPVRIAMQGPAHELALLMASLGQGPTETNYGTICLDFPLLTTFFFLFDANGKFVVETTLPYE